MASNFTCDDEMVPVSEERPALPRSGDGSSPNLRDTGESEPEEGETGEGEDREGEAKEMEVEETLMHLPAKLRQLLMEYKKADMTFEEEIRFLKPLAEYYELQYASHPELWTAGLRAHALWIDCSLRDSENSDYIKSACKLMKSKLSLGQLSAINTENKEVLRKYRVAHRTQNSKVRDFLSNIDSTNWSNNVTCMKAFTSAVQLLSLRITEDIKTFFGQLLDQCVESLGIPPPCGMAVIAIGSLARNETTSFSDIEYLFVIENGKDTDCLDYFRQLAFQSYYFLSMLGESNLLTYSIKELKAVGFVDRCKKALRIDGLADKAGNMPTGNDLEGSELLFTEDQLVRVYQEVIAGEYKGPNKEVDSDPVDMITHRALVCSTGNGEGIYQNLDKRLKAICHAEDRRKASLKLLKTDLANYKFLPDFQANHSGHREIKWDIYRYPSLLLTGLNNTLDLKLDTNWETVDYLVSAGKCSEDSGVILSFLLASAIFIRIDCYHFYDEQKDKVTVFQSEENSPDQYSCARDLFVLMMSYLFPLKGLLTWDSSTNVSNIFIPSIEQDTFTAVCITYYYCGAEDKVIDEFYRRYGQEMIGGADEFLRKVSGVECDLLLTSLRAARALTERHVKLVEAAFKLHPDIDGQRLIARCYLQTNAQKALLYAQKHLKRIRKDDFNGLRQAHSLLADCHEMIGNLKRCEKSLEIAGRCVEEMEKSDEYSKELRLIAKSNYLNQLGSLRHKQQDYEGILKVSLQVLEVKEELYGPGVIHDDVCVALNNVGLAYTHVNQPKKSMGYYTRSLDMMYKLGEPGKDQYRIAATLANIGCGWDDLGEYKKAEENLLKSYAMLCRLYPDVTPTHPMITLCMGHIAKCYYNMSDFNRALHWYKEQYPKLAEANDVNKHRLGFCTFNMGGCLMKLGDSKSAIDRFKESIQLFSDINENGRYDNTLEILVAAMLKCQRTMSSD